MSIATPTWTSVQTLGRPTFSGISSISVSWQRIPALTSTQGFGFGQGGFGQGGFGGTQAQSGTALPNWTRYNVE